MIERSAGVRTTTTPSELAEAFHARSIDHVLDALDTKHEGLSSAEAASRWNRSSSARRACKAR